MALNTKEDFTQKIFMASSFLDSVQFSYSKEQTITSLEIHRKKWWLILYIQTERQIGISEEIPINQKDDVSWISDRATDHRITKNQSEKNC